VRITAQLIDAATGNHLWADCYDRNLKDIFALQDEITMKLITELQVNLSEGELARVRAKGTKNLDTYLNLEHAAQRWRCATEEDNIKARELCDAALAFDPKYSRSYCILGATHWSDAQYGWSKSPSDSIAQAEELVQKSLELDNSNALAHIILVFILRYNKQWDKALAESELAVSLGQAFSLGTLATTYTFLGRFDEAIALFKKAFRLDPFPQPYLYQNWGRAYFGAERYGEALSMFKHVLKRARKGAFNLLTAYLFLAMTYAMLGLVKGTRNHMTKLLGMDPYFSLKDVSKRVKYYKNQVNADHIVNAVRQAVLPE
jgi:adenylate cyclase